MQDLGFPKIRLYGGYIGFGIGFRVCHIGDPHNQDKNIFGFPISWKLPCVRG